MDDMTETLPDLFSASAVHDWETQRRNDGWQPQDFFDHYTNLGTPIALFRTLKHATVLGSGRLAYEESTCQKIIQEADHPVLRVLAQAIHTWRVSFRKNKNQNTKNTFVSMEELSGTLDAFLLMVRESNVRGEFSIEAEYHIVDLLVDRDYLLDVKKVLGHAQVLLALSHSLTDYHIAQAYATFATAQYFNLNFLDCFNLTEQSMPLMEKAGLTNTRSVLLNKAFCHMNLLNPEAGMIEIAKDEYSVPQVLREAVTSFFKMMYGTGGHTYDFEATQQDTGIMINLTGALQHIMELHQMVPTKQNFTRRRQILGEALVKVSSRTVKIAPVDLDYENWLKAYLNLKSEKYSLAQHFLQKIGTPKEQDLFSRTVVAGLKLELASVVGKFEVEPVDQTLQELVAAYEFAGKISPTNSRNYLKLLHRWFPVATSMLHYVHPSLDIEPYKQAVVNFNHQNMAHGISLPMPYCLELMLREVLGREEAISPPPLNGDMTRDRESLFVTFEEIEYFRVPITCFKLIYLLSKSKVENRDTLIQVILEDCGLPRRMKTKYENFLVEKSLGLIQQLASGEISTREFDDALVLLA